MGKPIQNNYDFLRLALASAVMLGHNHAVTGVDLNWFTFIFARGEPAVECFFVISGILVYESLVRSGSLGSYFSKRFRRLYPGYLAAVLFCIGLGVVLSSLPPSTFLFSMETLKYAVSNLTFLNFLQPSLPGVFADNNLSIMNASLWTIKIEVGFYILLPFIVYMGKKGGLIKVLCLIYLLSIFYKWAAFSLLGSETLSRQIPGQLSFFVSGIAVKSLISGRDNLSRSWLGALVVLAIIEVLLSEVNSGYFLNAARPLALGFLVYALAELSPWFGNWGKFGDLSYGVYIYHFPVWQTLYSLGSVESLGFFLHTLIGILIVLTLSWFSWHFIEKRFLLRSSHYLQAESRSGSN